MSFEGYYQILCRHGHYHTVNCYDVDRENWRCPFCESKIKWENLVNITNGCEDEKGNDISGHIDMSIYIRSKGETCNCCGNKLSYDTYNIPADRGHLYVD